MADPRHVPATAHPGHCVACRLAPGIQPRAWGRVCIFCDSAVASGHLPITRPAAAQVTNLWLLIAELRALLGASRGCRVDARPSGAASGGDHG